ncbi:MAG: hypothetical protein M3220_02255 [Chloroflexota bacterium]|nr:hypothetical protein [Chloroflexota bacterium]
MSNVSVLTAKAFRAELPKQVRTHLPAEWHNFKHRSHFSLVQFWYDEPAFHFEVWPQRKRGLIEVGLHLEHREAGRNAALHRFFDRHFLEIRHELGAIWLEKWDRGWHKLYKTFPFARYNEALLKTVSQEAARQIVVLQPFLREALEKSPPSPGGRA